MGDYNCTTDKLNSFISHSADTSWSILPINGSNISWSKGHKYSDIDHAIVNSKMFELISYSRFVNFFPVSDHKPLVIYNKKYSSDSFITPKKVVRWDRLKCKEESKTIFDNNIFAVLEDNYFNGMDHSTESLVNNFIASSYSLAKDLKITTTQNIRKQPFKMSKKVFVLQKLKVNKYRMIKKYGRLDNLDEFIKITSSFKRLCKGIKKDVTNSGKKNFNIGLILAVVSLLKMTIKVPGVGLKELLNQVFLMPLPINL